MHVGVQKGLVDLSVIQQQLHNMILVLPEKTLLTLKPLINELLTAAVLSKDPTANVADMDELDKAMFLRSINKLEGEFITFDEALG